MFKTNIKATFIAGALALGGIAATAGTASAGDFRGGIYFGDPGVSIGFGDYGPRRHYRYGSRWDRYSRWDHHDRWYRYDRPRRVLNRCSPREALRKARKEGVRKGHIFRVNRRGIVVAGKIRGERVRIAFKNNRKCSVRFVKALY